MNEGDAGKRPLLNWQWARNEIELRLRKKKGRHEMKKFLNRPENAVEEMIEGLAVLSPGAMRLPGHKAMIREDSEKVRELQVAVISGDGSGHEPAHAGYIGAGMLSASVLGAVFTSKEGPRAWHSGPKQSKRGV